MAWWRHQIEAFFALLALCAGNSPVTGEFPTQKASDVELNDWVNNREAGDLRRHRAHYDVMVMGLVLKRRSSSALATSLALATSVFLALTRRHQLHRYWRGACAGPYITIATWIWHKTFCRWKRSFQWKLCHWLKYCGNVRCKDIFNIYEMSREYHWYFNRNSLGLYTVFNWVPKAFIERMELLRGKIATIFPDDIF